MSTEISDSGKTKLTGRIYPAIQSCVSIRYKIIVGYFAIVGFFVINKEQLNRFIDSNAAVFLAVVFTLFIIHNFFNYWFNAKEQWELEKQGGDKKFPCPRIEVWSSIVMALLIWGGYFFLKIFFCTA